MLNLSKEEILARLESAAGQKILESPEITKKVSEISEKYNMDIDPVENLIFHQLVALTALGVVMPNDLASEIKSRIDIEEEAAIAAANEVKTSILSGVRSKEPDIKPVVMAGLPPKQNPAPVGLPAAQATQTPVFGPGRPAQTPSTSSPAGQAGQAAAPFVIHSNEEIRSNVNIDAEAQGTVRPVFYKPVSVPKQPTDYVRPSAVRVDMGGANGVNPQAVPKTVNYTVRTPQAQPKVAQTNPAPVDPENVVDLKVGLNDLPK